MSRPLVSYDIRNYCLKIKLIKWFSSLKYPHTQNPKSLTHSSVINMWKYVYAHFEIYLRVGWRGETEKNMLEPGPLTRVKCTRTVKSAFHCF